MPISINGIVLSNEEVDERLKDYGGIPKKDVCFLLNEQFKQNYTAWDKFNRPIKKTRYQSSFGLQNECHTPSVKTGALEHIQYYNKTVRDQYQNERKTLGGDPVITIYDGKLVVKPSDRHLLLFMRMHSQNSTNPVWDLSDEHGNPMHRPTRNFKFKEVIPQKEAGLDYEKTRLALEAQILAMEEKKFPDESARTLALGYGMAEPMSADIKAVRTFLVKKALEDPKKFISDATSNRYHVVAVANYAFREKLISFDPEKRWVYWDGGAKRRSDSRICLVPSGKDWIEYFAEWMLTKDVSGVYNELKGIMETGIREDDQMEELTELQKLQRLHNMTEEEIKAALETAARFKKVNKEESVKKKADAIKAEKEAAKKEEVLSTT